MLHPYWSMLKLKAPRLLGKSRGAEQAEVETTAYTRTVI